ncbi:hypothetical protein D1224_02525 [Henriciella barbarensis]|uniref:Uncharacterized protein n=1 Tax=Henriciella barbarensis TaxID=86342 RepID=A0A399R920_9PROT|nr:DUF6665 family protein [Henriciella barbarensis]RIJ26009.1 hypothetical protein D1224_02525 [Henriciella barbarensis]
MAVRAPKNHAGRFQDAQSKSSLKHEIASEQANALGRSGRQVAMRLRAYREALASGEDHQEDLHQAVEAVYSFLIQRELLGLRDRSAIIRDYDIPREILARLGTSGKRY